MEKKKLYIVGPQNEGEGVYFLIADDGEGLASHYCSSLSYAYADLAGERPERQKKWKEQYGDYQVFAIGEDSMTRKRILELSEEWYRKVKPTTEELLELEKGV